MLLHLSVLMLNDDSLPKISPTHTKSVNRNLTASSNDRRLSQANAGVVSTPYTTDEVIIA